MNADQRSRFVSAYTQILLAAWSSRQFADELADDPLVAIAQFGLEIPDGAEIDVCQHIRPDHAEPNLDFAVSEWESGEQSGMFRLYVPSTPQMHLAELDTDDLAVLSAGFGASQCCCTPCCCCE